MYLQMDSLNATVIDTLTTKGAGTALLLIGSIEVSREPSLLSLYDGVIFIAISSMLGWFAVRLLARIVATKMWSYPQLQRWLGAVLSRALWNISDESGRSMSLLMTTVIAVAQGALLHACRQFKALPESWIADQEMYSIGISIACGLMMAHFDFPFIARLQDWWRHKIRLNWPYSAAAIEGVGAALLATVPISVIATIALSLR